MTSETLSPTERRTLRELARRVAEIAELPIQEERRRLWRRHHALQPPRPMMLIFPEGSWAELLPEEQLTCEHPWARGAEANLRMRIYAHDHMDTDQVTEKTFATSRHVGDTGWGLPVQHVNSDAARGAWGFDPTMKTLADSRKLRHPEVTVDEAAAANDLRLAEDVFGDILAVRQKGVSYLACHLSAMLTGWRGMDQVCIDMIEEPGWVHDTMAFIVDGLVKQRDQWERDGLLSLNNEDDYHSSGGIGYTDELPAADFDPGRVRLRDLWGSAESQEMTMVSPAMHAEFVMAYEKRFIEPFGLTGYGCCDDLTLKLGSVCALPNMRRISISPFADVARCAEQLKGDYILSWKPHPGDLVGDFAPERIRGRIRGALAAAREHGCVFEMILKDTHTCDRQPERFDEWSRIARAEIERVGEG